MALRAPDAPIVRPSCPLKLAAPDPAAGRIAASVKRITEPAAATQYHSVTFNAWSKAPGRNGDRWHSV